MSEANGGWQYSWQRTWVDCETHLYAPPLIPPLKRGVCWVPLCRGGARQSPSPVLTLRYTTGTGHGSSMKRGDVSTANGGGWQYLRQQNWADMRNLPLCTPFDSPSSEGVRGFYFSEEGVTQFTPSAEGGMSAANGGWQYLRQRTWADMRNPPLCTPFNSPSEEGVRGFYFSE